jgi:anti-sigma factor RsiW
MIHPTENDLAAYAAGLLTEMQSGELADHVAACPVCDRAVSDYRGMTAAFREWHDAPPQMVEGTHELLLQRIRLHRLFQRLFTDQELRRRMSEDPGRELAAQGIAATPAILAAFRDLGSAGPERFPGELDERLSKFRRLLGFFPGMPPSLEP